MTGTTRSTNWMAGSVVVVAAALAVHCAQGQTGANTAQQLLFAGLRTSSAKGQIAAVKVAPAGDLYVLYGQGDGIRVLELSADGATVEAQAQLGAPGDLGTALELDPAGNVYVTGTSTSGTLSATSGAALPAGPAGTTSSFVARFSPALTLDWLTFTGGSRIAASALAANATAVYVAGITYGTDLPVTDSALEQTPAYGSTQNGFVESFSADGSTLLYATYLSGAEGDTTPTGIAADSRGNAWVVGSTSASGFPTVAALIPNLLSSPSGFALELTPAGDGLTWSTFVPGAGLSSIAFDPTSSSLVIGGAVALGQFPVATSAMPLVPTTYQTLLRLSSDGSNVQSGTVIAPGLQSVVTLGPNGEAWLGGEFAAQTAPLLPALPLAGIGDAYAVRVNPSGAVDQTARFGGLPDGNLAYSSLPLALNGLATDLAGDLLLAGTVSPTASANLLGTESYDLPLRRAFSAALPSSVRDAEAPAGTCSGSLCSGSAGYLAKLSPDPGNSSLALCVDALPFVTLHNLGTADAAGLTLASTSGTLTTTCPSSLAAGAQCDLLLTGGQPGTLTVTANGDSQTIAYPPYAAPASTLVFSPKELDFGIQTSASPAAQQTITVANLGASAQTFVSNAGIAPKATSPFSEASSDCTLTPDGSQKILPAGQTCHVTLAFSSAAATQDGFASGDWTLGAGQILLTGYQQAAAISVSAAEIDFGTVIQGGLTSPRFLFLSNSSSTPVPHAAVALPADSPFAVADGCPATLAAHSICRLRLDYASPTVPSTDSVSLALDAGIAVLVTGNTVPPQTLGGSSASPSLSVSPLSESFAGTVAVTTVSSATQTVGITNTGTSASSLTIAVTGDFLTTSSCGPTLAAGATCAVAVRFAPSQPGLRNGLLSVTAGAGTSPSEVALSGTGSAILAANNGSLVFGSDPVAEPLAQFYKVTQPFSSLTVTTTGPYQAVLVEDAGYGHGTPPVSAYASTASGSCRNCWVGVLFTPAATGSQNGSLTFRSDPGGLSYTLALSGSGLAISGLIVTPSTQDFGPIAVDSTSGSAIVSLTNLNASASGITLSAPTIAGDFVLSPPPAGNQPCSGSLAYGDTCFAAVSFAPSSTGARTGAVTFATSQGNALATLRGTGIPDPGIALIPESLTFAGSSASGSSQTVTLRNTGASPLQIGTPTTTTASFAPTTSCGTLAANASCTITVIFTPTTQPVADTLSLPVSTGSGSATQTTVFSVALTASYTAAAAGLTIAPAMADFGPSATGQLGPVRLFTIGNQTAQPLALTVSLPQQFVLQSTPCTAVAANASCSFTVASIPLLDGMTSGSISVSASPPTGATPLTALAYAESYGTGAGSLALSGALIVNGVYSFGQVTSGQTATQIFTLTNTAAASVTVRRITSAAPFLAASTCESTLAPSATCTVSVTYTPRNQVANGTTSPPATGDAGVLTIASDAQTNPLTIDLAGEAGAAGTSAPSDAVAVSSFLITPGSLSFAATTVGDQSVPQTVTLTNTGSATLSIAALSTPPEFSVTSGCSSVAPAASCSLTIASAPVTAGTHIAALEIASNAVNALDFVSLVSVGLSSPLTFSPSALNFGQLQVGSSATLPLTLSNSGSAPVAIASLATTGDYTLAGDCPARGGTLSPQASCTAQITFAPSAPGTRAGTLNVVSSASTMPLSASLTGVGTASQLVLTPSSLAFGSIAVGASANRSLTLTNQGTAPVTGLALTLGGPYALTIPCPSTTLAAGASCTLQITFTPTATGAQNGSLTIASSDPSSPATVPLTGIGVANAGFTLTVNGAATASVAIASGAFATFSLQATPTGSFAGDVALTCLPLSAAPDANCSLLPPTLSLAGGPATATASINTVTMGNGVAGSTAPEALDPRGLPPADRTALALLLPGLVLLMRRRRNARRWLMQALAMLVFGVVLMLSGCGGAAGPTSHDTPPGTYSFQVSASSTAGVQLTQTVTLTLVVTAH